MSFDEYILSIEYFKQSYFAKMCYSILLMHEQTGNKCFLISYYESKKVNRYTKQSYINEINDYYAHTYVRARAHASSLPAIIEVGREHKNSGETLSHQHDT